MGSVRRTSTYYSHIPKYEEHGGHLYCNVPGCGYHCSSKKQSTMSMHNRNIHSKPTLPCLYCDKLFVNKTFLNQHIKSHHSDEKTMKCTQCNFTCKTKGTLYAHIARHYNYRRLFQKTWSVAHRLCSGCEKMVSIEAMPYHAAKCMGANSKTKALLTSFKGKADPQPEDTYVHTYEQVGENEDPLMRITDEHIIALDAIMYDDPTPLDCCIPCSPIAA